MKNKGFTLIEILIALLVFSIIAGALAFAFKTILMTHQKLEVKQSENAQLEYFWLVLTKDLHHAVVMPGTFKGDDTSFSFLTSSNQNPLATEARGNIIRVTYEFKHNELRRVLPEKKHAYKILLKHVYPEYIAYLGRSETEYGWPNNDEEKNSYPSQLSIKFIFPHHQTMLITVLVRQHGNDM